MYYALTNFYQNHREYVDSRDDNQLRGDIGTVNSIKNPDSNCRPLDKGEHLLALKTHVIIC